MFLGKQYNYVSPCVFVYVYRRNCEQISRSFGTHYLLYANQLYGVGHLKGEKRRIPTFGQPEINIILLVPLAHTWHTHMHTHIFKAGTNRINVGRLSL